MKIRTQFIVSTAIFGAILITISVLLVVTNLTMTRLNEQEQIATDIEREASELSYLSNDYLLFRETQQRTRWESMFASLSDDLSRLEPDTPGERALVGSMQENRKRLQAVFTDVVAAFGAAAGDGSGAVNQELVQISWSRMAVQNQGTFFDALRLSQSLRDRQEDLRQTRNSLTYVLIGVFGAFVVASYVLTYRSTLRSIAILQEGTRVVGSGNLDHAIPVRQKDEIGDLTLAFNQMTASLKTVTASKTDLEREIAERKRSEAALKESEEKYRSLFDTMSEGFALHEIILDATGKPTDYRFLEVNEAFGRMTGLTPAVVKGKTVREVIPAIEESWIETYGKVALTGESTQFENYSAPLSRWYQVRAYSPRKGQFATVFSDITARREMEEALRQSQRDLNRAQAVAHTGSWRLDIRGNELVWSAEAYRIFGVPIGTPMTYDSFLTTIHPEDREYVDTKWAAALRGEPYDIQHRIVAGGETKWVHETAELEFDEKGTLRGGFGTVQDITERRRLEHEVEMVARFPGENPNPILRVDRSGVILYANPSAASVLRQWQRQVGDTAPDDWQQMVRDTLAGSSRVIEMEVVGRIYSMWLAPIPAAGYVNIYGRDITELKEAEKELRERSEELARSNAELEQFAYVASHDLQEPLRMVSSYVQLLARRYKDKLDQDANDFIDYAYDGATRMQNLINDLLAYSRVGTRGKLSVPVNLEDALSTALDNLKITIAESAATIERGRLPVVMGDEGQLTQVFQNLIGNAIKFRGAAPPLVEISATLREGEWVISVRDNGIGIDPQYFDRLFNIFQRLHGREKYPGTGIGLAICKRIMERHGGRIWVESQPDNGATFSFTVPEMRGG